MDHSAQGCGANTIQPPAKIATQIAKWRSNQSDSGDQKISTPTPPGPDWGMRLPAKPYQNAIASAVQRMAERKNSFGRGKNETNIVYIQAQVRGFAAALRDILRVGRGFKQPVRRGSKSEGGSARANSSTGVSTAPRPFPHLTNSSRRCADEAGGSDPSQLPRVGERERRYPAGVLVQDQAAGDRRFGALAAVLALAKPAGDANWGSFRFFQVHAGSIDQFRGVADFAAAPHAKSR